MSDPDYELDVPINVRFHQNEVDQILESVVDGVYCAVLGPRLCGKTVLLRFVEKTLVESMGWTCLYLDLREVSASTLHGFFAGLTRQVAVAIRTSTGQDVPAPPPELSSSAQFRGYLLDCLLALDRDLVLILDNLESTSTDLVQALLTSLRAAFMDQQDLDYHLTVVVSGALSLATLTVGESSPFRGIARRVFVGDLPEEQSRSLIAEYLAAEGVDSTRQARENLLHAARGDAYLVRKLTQRCVERVQRTPGRRLGSRSVHQVTRAFLRDDVHQYAPLVEAVRLIGEDPDLLRSILRLLEHEPVPKAELPLPLSPDLDPLYLTGVVDLVDGGCYRLQNLIYRQYLADHFEAGRVGHLLSMAGLWDEALDYLEAGLHNGDAVARTDLLSAILQSMFAAGDRTQAAAYLTRGLVAGFGAKEVQVWAVLPGEDRLWLIGNAGEGADAGLWSRPEIPLQADRLEARAFRQAHALRGGESQTEIQRAIPLSVPGVPPLGVVTVVDRLTGRRRGQARERDLQMMGFLNQAARAFQAVSTRRYELSLAGRIQSSLLPESPPEQDGWRMSATWLPARETSGDFYDFIEFPNGRVGVVVGDVTDKGMGAALYMALCRTLIRTYAAVHPGSPAQVLRAANRQICADTHGGLFIPLFYGLLDLGSGRLTYCNAGHHPPYHIPQLQHQEQVPLTKTGIPLGVEPEAAWEEAGLQLEPGDLLLLYTDGVVEAQNPEHALFGTSRMLEVVSPLRRRSPEHIQEALVSAVRAFTADNQLTDDLTLVLVRREK